MGARVHASSVVSGGPMGSHIGAACTGDRVTCQTVAMFEGLQSVSRDGQFVKTGRIEPVCQFPRSATINV